MVPDSAVLTFYACISFFFPLAGTHDRYRTLTTKMIWPHTINCSSTTTITEWYVHSMQDTMKNTRERDGKDKLLLRGHCVRLKGLHSQGHHFKMVLLQYSTQQSQ